MAGAGRAESMVLSSLRPPQKGPLFGAPWAPEIAPRGPGRPPGGRFYYCTVRHLGGLSKKRQGKCVFRAFSGFRGGPLGDQKCPPRAPPWGGPGGPRDREKCKNA